MRVLGAAGRMLGPWLLAALALGTYWAGNGRVSLFDRDEPRYAGTALRMAETGDWIVPYFNGRFRFQKPPLTYWLIAAATRVFGADEFGVRAVSGLCVALAAAFVWRLAERLYGRPAGMLAAAMFAFAPMPAVLAKLALPDAPLLLCAAACLWALQAAWRGRPDWNEAEARGAARVFWVALAASTLVKGPILPGMVAAFFAVFWLTARQTPAAFALAWRTGPLVALALAAPWFVAVGYATGGAFFQEALGRQLLDRFSESFDRRQQPPGFYLASAVLLFGPWIGYVLLTLARGGREWRQAGPTGLLAAWCLGSLALLECFRSKQPHYWAPAYPALAALAAGNLAGLWRGAATRPGWVHRITACWHAVLGSAGAAWLAACALALPPAATPALALGAALLGVSSLLAALMWLRNWPRAAFGTQWTAQVAVAVLASWWILPGWETERLAKPISRALARDHGAACAAFSEFEPTMAFYSGRPIALLKHLAAGPASSGLPVVCVATDRELHALQNTGGAWVVERTFVGWHRMHPDTLHLVRRDPQNLAAKDAPAVPR